MKLFRYLTQRARDFAPVISIGLVMLLPIWIKRDSVVAGYSGISDAEVVEAVSTAPYRIGRWVGADTPLPDAAGQQLRPTAALSRRYVHMDHQHVVDVTIIHSGDARNMVGHHPPICYPSNGWTAVESRDATAKERQTSTELTVAGMAFESQRYEFVRRSDYSRQEHIRVFNFFVLPDGVVTHSINDVHRQTSWLRAASSGVAQIQVLTHINVPESVARDVTGEILSGLTQVFEAVGVKFHGES